MSQQTWTFTPITRLGRTSFDGYRPALRIAQRRFSAMPASMHASLDPVVEQPTTADGSGACHRSASIATQRRSSSAVRGYSSLSIMFLSRHSLISTPACGSIQVVTKVARFSRALPSSISSSWTSRYALSGGSGESGSRWEGGASVMPPSGFAAAWKGFTASRRRPRSSSWGGRGPLCSDMRPTVGRGPVSRTRGRAGRAPGPHRACTSRRVRRQRGGRQRKERK
ncbi:hypothetical protein SVIOM342S_03640 [Streptomyces violaceorubidus]